MMVKLDGRIDKVEKERRDYNKVMNFPINGNIKQKKKTSLKENLKDKN
jgi:hypothetical protein